MPELSNPPVRLRRLARELRSARTATGHSIDSIARELGWYDSKLSRIENAKNFPSLGDVRALLDLYGVNGVRRTRLLEMTRNARRRNWWTEYQDVMPTTYAALEDEADLIRTWEPMHVPGLIQTPAYARALFSGIRPDPTADVIEQKVRGRLSRQLILTRPCPPAVVAVLGEAVFGVMAHDLRRAQVLVLVNAAESVTIRILPNDRMMEAGLVGSFSLLSFAGVPDVAYVETLAGETYMEDENMVAMFNHAFESILERSLSPEESTDWLNAILKETP
ncbi:MAG TPA: helix-turn-helix transcriptional regulator [Candidatus Dormibacteraeota bacterium]|nr:helix-turn-helix transcriptional regulator [Candidatus Dormibacteraeota bacterium]